MSPRPAVGKVLAYVTRGDRLLVFRQPRHPEAGLQVPAGTIEAGEAPRAAVLRELHEETGLGGFAAPRFLGTRLVDMRPFGRDELQRRHYFHVPLGGAAPERWRHLETCGGTAPAVEFELFWVAFRDRSPVLVARQADLLDRLRD